MNNVVALHGALVDALVSQRPDALNQPVTVAEIYQDLVPYRVVRASLGFALNADYEHALLRLLAGEEGLARIEPDAVRQTLIDELKSPNPNVGLFRNYAACDVFVSMPAAGAAGNGTSSGTSNGTRQQTEQLSWEAVVNTGGHDPEDEVDAAEAARDFAASPAPAADVAAPSTPSTAPTAASSAAQPCLRCATPLPAGRNARFCPECGHDQTRSLCRSCGETLENGWKFCIQCGLPIA